MASESGKLRAESVGLRRELDAAREDVLKLNAEWADTCQALRQQLTEAVAGPTPAGDAGARGDGIKALERDRLDAMGRRARADAAEARVKPV